jgi:hypothetical protein
MAWNAPKTTPATLVDLRRVTPWLWVICGHACIVHLQPSRPGLLGGVLTLQANAAPVGTVRAMRRQGRDDPDPWVGWIADAGARVADRCLARGRRFHELEPSLYPLKPGLNPIHADRMLGKGRKYLTDGNLKPAYARPQINEKVDDLIELRVSNQSG